MRTLLILSLLTLPIMISITECHAATTAPKLNLQMRRQEYLGRLKLETAKRFCGEDGMIRCFAISPDQCSSVVNSEFSNCLKATKIPDPVPLTGLDVEISENVGHCLGKKFGEVFEKKFKNAGECAVRK